MSCASRDTSVYIKYGMVFVLFFAMCYTSWLICVVNFGDYYDNGEDRYKALMDAITNSQTRGRGEADRAEEGGDTSTAVNLARAGL